MTRRIFVLPLVAISLLCSCSNVPDLRSDIAEFITSFSYDESRKVYLDCSYTRVDVSHEQTGNIITVSQEMSISVKDPENLVYDYLYQKEEDGIVLETKHHYVQKEDDHYLYYCGETTPQNMSPLQVKTELITKFFFKDEIEGIHLHGMYLGDSLLDTLPYIQSYVTIDKEKETLTYDMPIGVEKDAKGYDFSELLIVDKYGMTLSCDIYQTNGITALETTIRVTNNI